MGEKNSLLRHFLPQKVPLGTWKAKKTLMLRTYVKYCQKISQTSCIPPKALLEALIAFWQRPEKTLRNFQKFSVESPKKSNIKFFIGAFFPEKNLVDTRNAVFLTMQIFCQNSENPTIKLRNHKHLFFSETYHLLKKLLWRHNLQFWQPSLKIVHQKPKNTTHKVRKHMKKKYF